MPEQQFHKGDTVRLTPAGKLNDAPGYQYELGTEFKVYDAGHTVVMNYGPGLPEFTIRVVLLDGEVPGWWRERWYERVGGPW